MVSHWQVISWSELAHYSCQRQSQRRHNMSNTATKNSVNGKQASSPPVPSPAIDWNAVGFKVHHVNGHAHATFKNGKWSNVEFRAEEILQIHGFASCLNYGQVGKSLHIRLTPAMFWGIKSISRTRWQDSDLPTWWKCLAICTFGKDDFYSTGSRGIILGGRASCVFSCLAMVTIGLQRMPSLYRLLDLAPRCTFVRCCLELVPS